MGSPLMLLQPDQRAETESNGDRVGLSDNNNDDVAEGFSGSNILVTPWTYELLNVHFEEVAGR